MRNKIIIPTILFIIILISVLIILVKEGITKNQNVLNNNQIRIEQPINEDKENQERPTTESQINFFYGEGCPYCVKAEKFLDELKKKYPQLEIRKYELSKNLELIKKFYQEYNVLPQEQGYVPIVFTKEHYFVGFNEQIRKEIENCIRECLIEEEFSYQKIKIPIFGEINVEKFSLPLLAIIFGFFDGFNICSLGALVLILGLTIALKSKRKILILGGAFILITTIVYWFLIFLWHRLFVSIVPYVRRIEILIGLLSLIGGWYFLKEFLNSRKKGAVCKFGGISENLAKKIKNMFEKKVSILMILIAILFFAGAITVIEFPCSAFFPLLFAGILSKANISFYLSLFYIGLYLFFYMLDEILVLLVAVFTMKIWIASPKFITWLNLAASLMLFLFGFYYLLGRFLV